MPERESYAPGTPSWVDLMTTDPDAAKSFYADLFGWEYDDRPAGDQGVYTLCLKGGKSVAGLGKMNPEHEEAGMPPMWNTYVTVANADDAHAKISAAGGTNVSPVMDVMDAGRMAVGRDPTGAIFAVWEARNHIGCQLVNEHGTLTWNELLTPEVDRATRFYGQLFGWGTETMDMGPMTYTVFLLDDQGIAGAVSPPATPPNWAVYFAVDDCDGIVEAAKAKGATVVAESMDIPPGRMAALTDPQGAMFAVIKLANPPA